MSKRSGGERQEDIWIAHTELAVAPGHLLKRRLNELLAKHTGQSIETIERDTDRDNFLSADQSVTYGLVDAVLTSRTEGPGQNPK